VSPSGIAPRAHRVSAGGCTVNVVEWGDAGAPPVLLLHGGMAHARWWDLVAARLVPRLRVFAVDLPGHGDSPWLEPARYAHVEMPVVRDLLATLAAGPWTLGGHSNGGLQSVVAVTSERLPVVRLLLVDVPLDPGAQRLMKSGTLFRRMPQPRWATRAEAEAAFRLFPRDGDPRPDAIAHVAAHSVREQPDGSWTSKFDWRYFRGRDPEAPNPYRDFAAQLRRIPCPTLVVRGERSSIQSAEDHAAILAAIPDGRGVVVAGSGHNPHVERPAETAEAIARFVSG
jgi:pimeloyl-ACP methyl ester carboxylesterase